MEHNIYIYLNIALVVGCIIMSIVFLALPLPLECNLTQYRISLRFLAGAYMTVAVLKLIVMILDIDILDLISMQILVFSTLQAPLLSYALITLINPHFIRRRYLYIQLMPVSVLVVLYVLMVYRWGDSKIINVNELELLFWHPTIIVKDVFLFYSVFQLFSLTHLFHREIRINKAKIDDCFAYSHWPYIQTVRCLFYAALSMGVGAILLFFLYSTFFMLSFVFFCSIFYLVFGICYIQYPRVFVQLKPLTSYQLTVLEELSKVSSRFDWGELKTQVLAEKYYLRHGVTIQEMALDLKIGRTTLSRFVNGEEGMNFGKWINSLRIEEAKHLLLEYADYDMSQVAEAVGYADASNFIRQFKQIVGQTPHVWRKARQSQFSE